MCGNIFLWGHFNTQPSSIHMNRVFIHASLLFAQRDFGPSAHNMWEMQAKVTYDVTYLYKIRVAAQVILASYQCILHEDFSELKICVQVAFNYVNPVHALQLYCQNQNTVIKSRKLGVNSNCYTIRHIRQCFLLCLNVCNIHLPIFGQIKANVFGNQFYI